MIKGNLVNMLMSASLVLTATGFAQTPASSPHISNKQAIAEENTKEILLLMDTNKDGQISKQEWMNFMSAEFDRLDTDHNEYINQQELMKSRISFLRVSTETQGK